jgi:hypothetical protein
VKEQYQVRPNLKCGAYRGTVDLRLLPRVQRGYLETTAAGGLRTFLFATGGEKRCNRKCQNHCTQHDLSSCVHIMFS